MKKSPDAVDYRRYLDPAVLSKIGGLDLRARLLVEGYISGMHRSPYHGFSIEFAEHRQYVQGDDVRHIDWKVFGRTNKYYIKQYEEETNLVCVLAVDCSESMTYRSPQASMSKHEYATSIAAALSYLTLKQQDAIGLALFDRTVRRYIAPTNNPAQWKQVIEELENGAGPAKTSMQSVLSDLADRCKRKMMIVIISDFFDSLENIRYGLKQLKFRKNEIILCHVMDPAELDFPFRGPVKFEGLEEGGRLLANPQTLRKRYLQEVQHFVEGMRSTARELQLDYALYNTQSPLDVALSGYLANRSARTR